MHNLYYLCFSIFRGESAKEGPGLIFKILDPTQKEILGKPVQKHIPRCSISSGGRAGWLVTARLMV